MLAQPSNNGSMEPKRSSASAATQFLQCSVCTFENAVNEDTCEMCGASIVKQTAGEPPVIQLTMRKVNGRKFGLSIASLPDGHYVEKVQESGLAAETGKVSVGMKLIAINGSDTNSLSKQDCIMLFRNAKDTVTLDLINAPRPKHFQNLPDELSAALLRDPNIGRDSKASTASSDTITSPLFAPELGEDLADSPASTTGSQSSLPFPGRKMSTPENVAAMEHVENLTRMLDSLRSFGGVQEEAHGASSPRPSSEEAMLLSPDPTPAQSQEVVESFVSCILQRAREGPIDGPIIYGLYLEHWGDEEDDRHSVLSPGVEDPLSPTVVPGAKSAAAKERERLQRRIWKLESESRAIAKRLLDQQTTFAQQLNELESENESLRAYVDKLMCQLLSARMEQQTMAETKTIRSPRLRRPVSATE